MVRMTMKALEAAAAAAVEAQDNAQCTRRVRLIELEAVIRANLDGWVNAGLALAEVREYKLYRDTHRTIEAWANDTFSVGRARIYQLIEAVETRHRLSTVVDNPPTTERQCRELSKLIPADQAVAWEEARRIAAPAEPTSKTIKRVIRERNRQVRLSRMAKISEGNEPLEGVGLHSIILADPSWMYDEGTVDPSRRIDNQYPPMSVEDICALEVEALATPDAVLFLWVPVPLLPDGLEVMAAWGFSYRSGSVWDKIVKGMGYWFRINHEHLLVGVRGNLPPPAPGDRADSVFTRRKTSTHSAKPADAHEIIEVYYPELSKIELFARTPREGWSCWGNQSGGV